MKRILGLSAYYHDAAAALVVDGRIVAAAQEERFTRRKHDASFPALAASYCLESAGLRLRDVDAVVFYDKPFLKFERLLETYLANAPRGLRSFVAAMPVWMKEKLFLKIRTAPAARRARRRVGPDPAGPVQRTPSLARGLGVLPEPVRIRRGVVPRRRRRVGHRVGVDRPRRSGCSRCGRCTSRTRSACCIPHSRRTPASR